MLGFVSEELGAAACLRAPLLTSSSRGEGSSPGVPPGLG